MTKKKIFRKGREPELTPEQKQIGMNSMAAMVMGHAIIQLIEKCPMDHEFTITYKKSEEKIHIERGEGDGSEEIKDS